MLGRIGEAEDVVQEAFTENASDPVTGRGDNLAAGITSPRVGVHRQ
jgi:hypothetical protein